MNTGERNELLIKLRLVEMRMQNKSADVFNNEKIESVGFAGQEYLDIPIGYKNYSSLSDNDLIALGDLHHGLVVKLGHECGSNFILILLCKSRHLLLPPH